TATHNPDISKMTIVTSGDAQILEQIDKQLRKLVDVITVTDLSGSRFVERELVLVKVKAESAAKKAELIQIVQIFGAKFVTVNKKELGIELSGRSNVIDNFIDMVKDFGIVDLARSGRVAVSKE
ncbi:MAG: acetolactate synthase small subunit, partial [Lentisphaeria bacterium]|nr:acetolactate synthase small subunit [Lentisphaeria bacterium]